MEPTGVAERTKLRAGPLGPYRTHADDFCAGIYNLRLGGKPRQLSRLRDKPD